MRSSPESVSQPVPPEICAGLVEEAPYGVLLVQDGRIACANRWARALIGEIAGGGPPELLELFHPDDREAVREQLRQRLEGAVAPARLSARLARPAGEDGVADVETAAAVFGGLPAVRLLLTDATARAEADRAVRGYAARLDESRRFQRLFGDILSHDLMNPVWIAENYLRLAMDAGVADASRPFFQGMLGALLKAKGILSDARTYLRLQEQVPVSGERLEVAPLVEEVVESQRPLAQQKGQKIVLTLAPNAVVNGSSQLLRELVGHLLSNAIKFGPPQSEVEIVLAAGPRVHLEVRDRGPGVEPANRERVFERFENKDKGPITGVGLGLAVVRRVASLHGGRVWIEGNPGGGATFIAEFPPAE